MKKIYFLLMIALMSIKTYSQQGEWTWMAGDSTRNSLGHFGTQGVFDSLNAPPALYEACEWTDKEGNFWLFGGIIIAWDSTHYDQCEIGDLWEFKPSINQWAWMKGPGTIFDAGVYGVQGIPAPANTPGARGWGCLTWVDTSGDLWLYGGLGYNSINGFCGYSDLWKYTISTNEWTWMRGTWNNIPNYGIMGVESSSNTPGHREEVSTSWTGHDNTLWLFGGSSNTGGALNDLWKYNVSDNNWTWMKGSTVPYSSGIYGAIGVADSTNCPGSRWCYSKWRDEDCNFWLFGGLGNEVNGTSGNLNDLWKYDVTTNNWIWMSG